MVFDAVSVEVGAHVAFWCTADKAYTQHLLVVECRVCTETMWGLALIRGL